MKMLRLPRSKVQLGAPLPWNVRDDQGLLLLSRGHVVESEHQLDLLLERGAFVDAEDVKAVASQVTAQAATPVERHLNLFGLWDQAELDLHKLVVDASRGDALAKTNTRQCGHRRGDGELVKVATCGHGPWAIPYRVLLTRVSGRTGLSRPRISPDPSINKTTLREVTASRNHLPVWSGPAALPVAAYRR